jgi:predicted dehydrogenase
MSKRPVDKELKEAKKGERTFAAPPLPYQPRDPARYRPGIALVGCGGITSWHLTAYRSAGYNVVVLCDINRKRAQQRREEFYPQAYVTDDIHKALAHDDVEVVDITTHTHHRPPLIEAALKAGKHVLSQKPFVTDLDVGLRLADLADKHGVKLAVNQNARWAPHFSYIREAVRAGLLGQVNSIHCDVHWDHSWAKGTPFEAIRHLILYDFAIHWFDMLCAVMDGRLPTRMYATMTRSATQEIVPALLAQASVEYPSGQATLVFDGHTQYGRLDRTYVAGSKGTISSAGLDNDDQQLELATADGVVHPQLKGHWFPDGFHGTMGELLCAIEEQREPSHSARNNLQSLALCFAAVASAERGEPVAPGTVRRLPEE